MDRKAKGLPKEAFEPPAPAPIDPDEKIRALRDARSAEGGTDALIAEAVANATSRIAGPAGDRSTASDGVYAQLVEATTTATSARSMVSAFRGRAVMSAVL